LLIRALTAPYAVAVDAASFVFSTLLVVRIVREEDLVRITAERRSLRSDIVEDLRYVLSHP
jgi:hypothetical protein